MTDNQLLSAHGKGDIIRLFWLGFGTYTLAYFLSITFKDAPYLLLAGIQGIALLLIVPTSFSLVQRIDGPIYFKFLFAIYFLWSLSVLVRGFTFKFEFIQLTFLNAFEGGLYLFVPLVALFSKSIFFYRKMFAITTFFGVIFILYGILSFRLLITPDLTDLEAQAAIEYSAKILSIPSAFILLTQKYHSKTRNRIALFVLIITLLFAVIRARRGLVFITGFPLIFALGLNIFNTQKRKGSMFMKFLFIVSLFFIISVYITSFQDKGYGIFSSLITRSKEDTRSGVVYFFLQDMTLKDWVIGKGIAGQYYYPSNEGLYRGGIETDYLNIILKGGIVSLCLMLFILIPAIIKGIFFSRNSLSKAAGLWILLYVLCLYPSPMTKFSLFYAIVWISVGISYSSRLRDLPDDQLSEYFRKAF